MNDSGWVGEYLLGQNWGYDPNIASTIEAELTAAWPLLSGGAFGGDLERAKTAHSALVTWRAQNAFRLM